MSQQRDEQRFSLDTARGIEEFVNFIHVHYIQSGNLHLLQQLAELQSMKSWPALPTAAQLIRFLESGINSKIPDEISGLWIPALKRTGEPDVVARMQTPLSSIGSPAADPSTTVRSGGQNPFLVWRLSGKCYRRRLCPRALKRIRTPTTIS